VSRPADTIYALSSGHPPAAIAVVRVSGPGAIAAVQALTGNVPEARHAKLAQLRHDSEVIDNAIVIAFPGPNSVTGDDLAEFHIHGGRAVVCALFSALSSLSGLREAEPGEFTRRAFENGKMDLTEVEGLADLLVAETQSQRRAALALAGGSLSRRIANWRDRLLGLAAQVESILDFSDEGEVGDALPEGWSAAAVELSDEIGRALDAPSAERLRDGIRVVIAGPPNAGKSTLLNALAGRDAAITSAVPGTTRDVVEAPVAIGGMPFLFADTAGLRDSPDEIEQIGVERARARIESADILLWLGRPAECPAAQTAILLQSKSDLFPPGQRDRAVELHVSPNSGENMDALTSRLLELGKTLLPADTEAAWHERHRALLADCHSNLTDACAADDLLIAAEALRLARAALDRITGRAGVEDMLDSLFGRFCIGK
jgi:tRNA modification GTPase